MQGQYFDATQFEPSNGGGGPQHPIGPKFPGYISATAIKPTNNNDGQYFEVELTSQQGKIALRLNLWNSNPQAVDIAQRQLSALCYCTGVFKLDFAKQGAELHNKQLQFEVRQQKNNANYVEVGKLFDAQGNEPKAGGSGGGQQQNPQQQQPQNQPFNQQPQNNNTQGGNGGGAPWNTGGGQQEQQPQNQNNNNPQGGGAPWQPGGGGQGGNSAPWNK